MLNAQNKRVEDYRICNFNFYVLNQNLDCSKNYKTFIFYGFEIYFGILAQMYGLAQKATKSLNIL